MLAKPQSYSLPLRLLAVGLLVSTALALIAIGLVGFLADDAFARPRPGRPGGRPPIANECVAECYGEQRSCFEASHAAARVCTEEAGCSEARSELRAICRGEDADPEACAEARALVRACVEPCHEGFAAAAEICRAEARTCALESCGVDLEDRPARPGRFQRPERRGL